MIEVIATTLEDARRIEKAGADRIELVSALTEGGLTPSYALIKNVVQNVSIPVNVMIRPHARSFIYSRDEIELMVEDIIIAKELNVNGVVLGVLNKEGKIHKVFLERLLKFCDGVDVTFHRAIDEISDPVNAVKILSEYQQIKTILTSGGKGRILDNISTITNMIKNSGHINILVGGGLNFDNIKEIVESTKAHQYHFGTAIRYNNSPFDEINIEKLKNLVRIISDCTL